VFSAAALARAVQDNAKVQNWVYNSPVNAEASRPQELFLTSEDGYTTVVSCVATLNPERAVYLDVDKANKLVATVGDELVGGVHITYVPQPSYYQYRLPNGDTAKQYVSACGFDELNIIPWKGCFISKMCKFCGVNTVTRKVDGDSLNAFDLSYYFDLWQEKKGAYLANLKVAVEHAMRDDCYNEHMHVIMISGNLADHLLDKQAEIYAEVAAELHPLIAAKSTEGIIAVITPPRSLGHIDLLKQSGIDIAVFNLEVGNEPWFSEYCPGKRHLGLNYFNERLDYAVNIFGRGKVWTNFVLGLEPIDPLLELCDQLASKGIASSANVLHLDEGNRLLCSVPTHETVMEFFYRLSEIYKKYNLKPFYCAKALRTSLSNEAFEGRIAF